MDVLQKFLDEQTYDFDIESLMSDELKRLDTVQPPSSIYKYYGPNRRAFFHEPTLRFTQRTELNDPFELMKRWRHFASDGMRDALRTSIKTSLGALAQKKGLMLEMYRQQQARHGVFLGPQEMAKAASVLLTERGKQHYQQAFDQTINAVDQQIDLMLAMLDIASEQTFHALAEGWGILSLCENAHSRMMWSHYTASGQGFMVEFDPKHSFFAASNGRCLLWQVNYKDDSNESFFENPMALFLTKHTDYAFEKEWRMIKQLNECEIHDQDVHLCLVRPGMIKSISFGYDYAADDLARDGAHILTFFDSDIRLRQAIANRASGTIEFHELNSGRSQSEALMG